MQQTGDYQVIAVVPSSYGQYTIWAYRPAKRSEHHVATSERALYRSGAGRHRIYGLGLPAAPSDEEKTGYCRPEPGPIIRTSLASFGALLISQARFVFLNAAIHVVVLAVRGVHHRLLRHLPVR